MDRDSMLIVVLVAFLAALVLLGQCAEAAEPEVVAWEVLRNGLVEIAVDTSGDGVADRVELHPVAYWEYTALSDRALLAQAVADDLWLFVAGGDPRLVYFVVIEALFVFEAGEW